MRLLNTIWDKLLSDSRYESKKLTYMEIDSSNFEKLKEEFLHEFELDEVDVSDLELYFNLKLVLSEKKGIRFV